MRNPELWQALTEFARRLGLIERGQRLEIVGDPRDEPATPLCLEVGEYRGTRLCCTYARGHRGAAGNVAHSWERGLIGRSACMAVSGLERPASDPAPRFMCERPTHHAGEHKATGADGVRWTWGDAPKPCGDIAPDGTAVCARDAGHEPPHQSAVKDLSYDMWPVDAYGRVDSDSDPSIPRA